MKKICFINIKLWLLVLAYSNLVFAYDTAFDSNPNAQIVSPKLVLQIRNEPDEGFFSNDGKQFLTTSSDGVVFWDRKSGRIVEYYRISDPNFNEKIRHSAVAKRFSYSIDESKQLSATKNGHSVFNPSLYRIEWDRIKKSGLIKHVFGPSWRARVIGSVRGNYNNALIVGSVLYLWDDCSSLNIQSVRFGDRYYSHDDLFAICQTKNHKAEENQMMFIGINIGSGKIITNQLVKNFPHAHGFLDASLDEKYVLLLSSNNIFDLPVILNLKTLERQKIKNYIYDARVLRICPSGEIIFNIDRFSDLDDKEFNTIMNVSRDLNCFEEEIKSVFIFDPLDPYHINSVFKDLAETISPSCKEFIAINYNNKRGVFSFKTEEFIKSFVYKVDDIRYSGDGSVLLLYEKTRRGKTHHDAKLLLTDAKKLNVIKKWKVKNIFNFSNIFISHDGTYVQLCGPGASTRLFSMVGDSLSPKKLEPPEYYDCTNSKISSTGILLVHENTIDKLNDEQIDQLSDDEYDALSEEQVAFLTDVNTDEVISKWKVNYQDFPPTSFFSKTGNKLYIGTENVIEIRDGRTGKLLEVLKNEDGLISSMTLSYDDKLLITTYDSGAIVFWDVHSKNKRVLARMVFGGDRWLVAAPDGRFDSNNLDSIPQAHWIMPDDPLTPLAPEVFMRDYYEPRLLQRILDCTHADWNDPSGTACNREFPALPALADLNRAQPVVSIESISPHKQQPDQVTVEVKVQESIRSIGSGDQTKTWKSRVCDLRLFRDGQIVGSKPGTKTEINKETVNRNLQLEQWSEVNCKIELDKTGSATLFFPNVRLPQRAGIDQVTFNAYAFNEDRVKSETDSKVHKLRKEREVVNRRAYIVTVGVEHYENDDWNLNFAADDAKLMSTSLEKRLLETGNFQKENIVAVQLIAEKIVGKQSPITHATKANIRAIFQRLAGKQLSAESHDSLLRAIGQHTLARLKAADPDDLVFIAYSSHGYADNMGNFYLFPYDIGKYDAGAGKLNNFLDRTISSNDLSNWLQGVDAGELALIVDACYSAAVIEQPGFKPGPMGARGLGQLAYDKGMRVLTATRKENVAHEIGAEGLGLLTSALVKDGLNDDKADFKPKNKRIELGEWLRYGVKRVPELYQQHVTGSSDESHVTKDPLLGGMTNRQLKTIQQPTLFDFRSITKKKDLSVAIIE